MKALDTNLLTRLLVHDDSAQTQRVNLLLQEAETTGEVYFVHAVVISELIWVLARIYDYPRADIVNGIDGLLRLTPLVFDSEDRLRRWVGLARSTNTGLTDLLIGLLSHDHGCETTLTFDKAAAKSDLFEKF